NARAFAAMANRPPVRHLLGEQGITIPDDTWFVGAQHDTCSDIISWFDLEQIPAASQAEFAAFKACVEAADGLAAAERCRRFASSAYPKTARAAVRHVENRAMDLSQVRPEFGHATNAAAFIGRRAATQGIFFDRRLFLISYDPSQDADGGILENILLTAGPVGAGISLEYYFSSVNNERLGCGTKIPHNVTGLFGVMEGAGSDLRTGLPLQMVEIHEAMRLQIVVEAKTDVLERIYGRQESLRELIGGGWVHLSAKDPDSGDIFVFRRGSGFMPWQAADEPLPLRDNSPDCYRDETRAVAPMLIKQPSFSGESD
ncbi:putative inorganic carbon transporter subunit DabA, partial [Methylomonas rivi]